RGENNLQEGVYLYPICIGWQTALEINNKCFYTQVLEGNKQHKNYSGYQCQSELKFSNIESSPSPAITSLYMCLVSNTSTKFSGPQILGWDNPSILEQSLDGVEFRPFFITVNKYRIYIIALDSNDTENDIARIGYTASFIGNYIREQVIYIQRIDIDGCYIEIYQNEIMKEHYIESTPNSVWILSKKFKKYRGTQLFGLEHPLIHQTLAKHQTPKCDITLWKNKDIMNYLYKYHLFTKLLQILNEHELRAWQAMLKATGCINITPFAKKESKIRVP
ncbi:11899_t:CDS:2, partial [Acaulospora morrowiae]